MNDDDKQPHDIPIIPTLISPTNPITSCDFTIEISADEDVFCEIYDESGRQISRRCMSGRPGPIGTIRPTLNSMSRRYEAQACLCAVRNNSTIRFVICPVDPAGTCVIVSRTVVHGGTCPSCPTLSGEEIDTVVEELRTAVTQRVVEELRDAVVKIGGGKKQSSAQNADETKAVRTPRSRRGRRRK